MNIENEVYLMSFLWDHSLWKWNGGSQLFDKIDFPDPELYAMTLFRKNENEFYIATNKGLYILDIRTKLFELAEMNVPDPNKYFVHIFPNDAEKDLWMMAWGFGLIKNSDSQILFPAITGNTDRIPHTWLHDMIQDSEGQIWVGTQYGLCRIDPNTNQVAVYYSSVIDRDFPNPNVKALVQDKNGLLWCSNLGKGITLIDPRE